MTYSTPRLSATEATGPESVVPSVSAMLRLLHFKHWGLVFFFSSSSSAAAAAERWGRGVGGAAEGDYVVYLLFPDSLFGPAERVGYVLCATELCL